MSNVIIIKCGFQKMYVPHLRLSTNKKGEGLFKSSHVKNVEEWQSANNNIKAQVIRQTKIKQHCDVSLDVSFYSINIMTTKSTRIAKWIINNLIM